MKALKMILGLPFLFVGLPILVLGALLTNIAIHLGCFSYDDLPCI